MARRTTSGGCTSGSQPAGPDIDRELEAFFKAANGWTPYAPRGRWHESTPHRGCAACFVQRSSAPALPRSRCGSAAPRRHRRASSSGARRSAAKHAHDVDQWHSRAGRV